VFDVHPFETAEHRTSNIEVTKQKHPRDFSRAGAALQLRFNSDESTSTDYRG
jgi:hypothetical protein